MLPPHLQNMLMALSPDGRFLASTDDATVSLFNARIGVLIQPFPLHNQFPTYFGTPGLAFTADGQLLLIGGSGSSVTLVRTRDGQVERTLAGPASASVYTRLLAASPDGKTLAALASNGEVYLWDLQTNELISSLQFVQVSARLSDQIDAESSLTFSSDGQLLLANVGGQVGMWSTTTREPYLFFTPEAVDRANNVVVSPDGKLLVIAEFDLPVVFRYAQVRQWQEQACSIANRNFTAAEWQQIFGSEPYNKTCAELPGP